jgi:flagellar protein FlaJ
MRLPASGEFMEIYEESGFSMLFKDYVKRMALFISMAFSLTAISFTLVHHFFLQLPGLKLLPAVFSLSIAASGLVAFALLYYPLHRRNQMRAKIENDLVYSLSYMTVLSASGISLERIMKRVSEVEVNPPLRQLAKKFMMDTMLFGFDVTSALKDISRRSPSEILKKLMDSMNNTVQTSGDLKGLLTYEVERQLQRKRDGLKKTMGTLTYLGEVYVTLMVVAPILFILMLTILSVIGSGPFGSSSVLQLNLIVFFGIPLIAAGFMIVLDTIVGGEE